MLALLLGVEKLDADGSVWIGELNDFSTSKNENIFELLVEVEEEEVAEGAVVVVAGAGLAELGVVDVVVVLYN